MHKPDLWSRYTREPYESHSRWAVCTSRSSAEVKFLPHVADDTVGDETCVRVHAKWRREKLLRSEQIVKNRPRKRGVSPRRALVCALALLAAPAAAHGSITGTVFRDYDADGVHDAREPGTTDVLVSAVNDVGAVVATSTTAVDGTYSLTGLASGEKVRIEFSGQASFLKQGGNGTAAGSSVLFATEGDTSVDHGVNNPAEFCEANPTIATACQFFGRFDSTYAGKGGLRVFGFDTADLPASAPVRYLAIPRLRRRPPTSRRSVRHSVWPISASRAACLPRRSTSVPPDSVPADRGRSIASHPAPTTRSAPPTT